MKTNGKHVQHSAWSEVSRGRLGSHDGQAWEFSFLCINKLHIHVPAQMLFALCYCLSFTARCTAIGLKPQHVKGWRDDSCRHRVLMLMHFRACYVHRSTVRESTGKFMCLLAQLTRHPSCPRASDLSSLSCAVGSFPRSAIFLLKVGRTALPSVQSIRYSEF